MAAAHLRSAFPLALVSILVACGGSDDTPADGDPDAAIDDTGATGASSNSGGSGNTSGDGDGDTTGPGDGDGDALGGTGGRVSNEPPRWEVTGITTWRGDATAAYTIFHDDTCNESVDNQFDQADPALVARGLVASFGAIAENCDDRELWDELETLRSHGHEIASHSYSHENLADSSTDVDVEIDEAHRLFEEKLVNFTPTFFIFPYDAFNDTLIERLRGLGYLGARAGERDINLANFPDTLRINFDVYGPGYSIYVSADGTPCQSVDGGDSWTTTSQDCRTYVMNQYVDDIIAAGGYGIRELHSLDGQAWEPLPLDEYEAHLDYVVGKVDAGDLWVATASDAVRYRRARDECTNVTVSGDTLSFDDVDADCLTFATALTYEITSLEGATTAPTATQAGESMPVVDTGGGTFRVDADPSKGPVNFE